MKRHHVLLGGLLLLMACTEQFRLGTEAEAGPLYVMHEEEGEKKEAEPKVLPNWAAHQPMPSLENLQTLGFYNSAGRNFCVHQDWSNPNRLWAGSARGGLWKSEDRAESWTPVQDQFYPMSVRAIAQDPFAMDTMYICTYNVLYDEEGQHRSDVLRSMNHGQSFDYLPQAGMASIDNIIDIECDPLVPNRLYALSQGPLPYTRLYRSDDAGESFYSVLTRFAFQPFSDLHIRSDGQVFVCQQDSIFYSPSGNQGSFQSIKACGTEEGDCDIERIVSAPSEPNRMYILSDEPGPSSIHRSDDGGLSWVHASSVTQTPYGYAMTVSPVNPDLMIMGETRMFISLDGAQSFVPWQALGVDYWDVEFDWSDPTKAFVAYDQGIGEVHTEPFVADPYQVQFEKDSALINNTSYWGDYFPTGTAFVTGMQDQGTAAVLNGVDRRSLGGGDGSWCFVHKQDTTVVYFSSQNGRILRDNDVHDPLFNSVEDIRHQLDSDGNYSIDEGARFIHPFEVLDQNSDVLFFPTLKRVWRSADRGENWTAISDFYKSTYFLAIYASYDDNPILYWTEGDSIFIHFNALDAEAGEEWGFVSPESQSNFILAHPSQDSVFFVGGGEGLSRCQVLSSFSIDCQSLTENFELADEGISSFVVDPNNEDRMYIGHKAGLFFSENGGETWFREASLPPVYARSLRLRASDRRMFIFTYGRGVWSADLPNSVPSGLLEEESVELGVFPNPSPGDFHLKTPQHREIESLHVYDMQGRLVRRRDRGQLIEEEHVFELEQGSFILQALDKQGQVIAQELIISTGD